MNTVYLEVSSHFNAFVERGFQQFIDKHIKELHSLNWTELINYFIYLFIYLFTYLLIYLFIYLFIYLSVHDI